MIEDLYLKTTLPTAPPSAVISCTLGCSSQFDVNKVVVDGDTGQRYPRGFSEGEAWVMVVQLDPPVRVTATLSGNTAHFTIPADIADQCRTGTQWQVSSGGVPWVVGSFSRHDGKT